MTALNQSCKTSDAHVVVLHSPEGLAKPHPVSQWWRWDSNTCVWLSACAQSPSPSLAVPSLSSITGASGCPLLHQWLTDESCGLPRHPQHTSPCQNPMLAAQAATKQDWEMGPGALGPSRRNSESPRHTVALTPGKTADANHRAFPKSYRDIISQHMLKGPTNSTKGGIEAATAGIGDSALPRARCRVTRILS